MGTRRMFRRCRRPSFPQIEKAAFRQPSTRISVTDFPLPVKGKFIFSLQFLSLLPDIRRKNGAPIAEKEPSKARTKKAFPDENTLPAKPGERAIKSRSESQKILCAFGFLPSRAFPEGRQQTRFRGVPSEKAFRFSRTICKSRFLVSPGAQAT